MIDIVSDDETKASSVGFGCDRSGQPGRRRCICVREWVGCGIGAMLLRRGLDILYDHHSS